MFTRDVIAIVTPCNTMEKNKIDTFVAAKSNYFTTMDLATIQSKMATMSDDRFAVLMSAELRNPTVIWVISFFFGALGIDRFLVGSVGAGIGKLLTFGGFGLWWLIDLFLITGKARQANYMKVMPFLN